MKILFEKYDIESGKILENWTKLFDNIDELLKFLGDNKWFIIGGVVIVAGAGVAIYFINKKRKIRNRGL